MEDEEEVNNIVIQYSDEAILLVKRILGEYILNVEEGEKKVFAEEFLQMVDIEHDARGLGV
ncbi:hypothetical protein KAR91_25340 [Candidatus Pacearchaeota archaeon]|nr:hypothetical protein [Candidatus Pacearchaeota archaeon]